MFQVNKFVRVLAVAAMLGVSIASPVQQMDPCTSLRRRIDASCSGKNVQADCAMLREEWNRRCVQTQQKPTQGGNPTQTGNDTPAPAPSQDTFNCAKERVVVDFGGRPQTLVEGDVLQFDVSLPPSACNSVPATVTLKPAKGVSLSTTTLSFNGPQDKQKYTVFGKFNPASGVTNGQQVTIGADWSFPSQPSCKPESHTITLPVTRKDGCSGQAIGDPHMRTFDGVKYDIMNTGVFKYAENAKLQVQGAIRRCRNAGCTYGVAMQAGNSIVRVVIENRQLMVAKGTTAASDLSVERKQNRPNQVRVFMVSDPSTYVDITMGHWAGTEYLDVTVRLSAGMCNGVSGLLGNANKNPRDDERNSQRLVQAFQVNGPNLFTCTGDCAGLIKPASESDKIALEPIALLHQGFNKVVDAQIQQRPSIMSHRRLRDAEEGPVEKLDEAAVRAQCEEVIRSIPHCDKYVKDVPFFIDIVCTKDTINVGDITNIDEAKRAYMRNCRMEMDDAIALSAQSTVDDKEEAEEDRTDLALGNPNTCPADCGEHGDCEADSCECHEGWSGLTCDVKVEA